MSTMKEIMKGFDETAAYLKDQGVMHKQIKALKEQVQVAAKRVEVGFGGKASRKIPASWDPHYANGLLVDDAFVEQITGIKTNGATGSFERDSKQVPSGIKIDHETRLDPGHQILINKMNNGILVKPMGYLLDTTLGALKECFDHKFGQNRSTDAANRSNYRRNTKVAAHDILISSLTLSEVQRNNLDLLYGLEPPKQGDTILPVHKCTANRVDFDEFWETVKDRNQSVFSNTANKQAMWEYEIFQSPYAQHFTDENVERFMAFLDETDARPYGRDASFYILITTSEGVPASRAGDLVKLKNGKSTGFWNMETNRNEGTVGDQVKQALLQKLPSPTTAATTFGSNFEFLAAKAFELQYEKANGVKLSSVKSEHYEQMVATKATGQYRNGLDELYYDKINDKYIVAEFKMPQALSKDIATAMSYTTLVDGYVYQASLYEAAAKEVLGADANIEVHIYQFGMQGLMEHQEQFMSGDQAAKDKLIQNLTSCVESSIWSGNNLCRGIDNVIETSPKLVNELLLPSLDFYQSFLDEGVAPKEPFKPKVKYTNEQQEELYELEYKHASLVALKNKIEAQNEGLKFDLTQLHQSAGEKIQTPLASTSETKRMPKGMALYEKAKQLGFDKDIANFMTAKPESQTALDSNMVETLAKKHKINIDEMKTNRVSLDLKENYPGKPSVDQVATISIRDMKHDHDALVAINKTEVEPSPTQDPDGPSLGM